MFKKKNDTKVDSEEEILTDAKEEILTDAKEEILTDSEEETMLIAIKDAKGDLAQEIIVLSISQMKSILSAGDSNISSEIRNGDVVIVIQRKI